MLLVPAIEEDFSVDITTTQWVLNIYALTFAVFMVAGGKLGDSYGRRRMMTIGLLVFIAASIGCALAPTIGLLILARAVQGLGAALVWPSMLGAGATLVTEERRGVVMGMLLACVNIGNVVGPLMGGLAVAFADWRFFFIVNIALACVSLLLCRRLLPAPTGKPTREPIDFAGIATLGLAVLALLFALDVGSDWGWGTPRLLGLLALSALLFVAFPLVERRVREPMIPPHWLRHREFRLLLLINGLAVPAIFIALLYFPQYLQKALGWQVLHVSVGVLPMMALLGVASMLSGRLYKPLGPKRLLTIGYLLAVAGSATAVWLFPSWGYFAILPPMILIALGAGTSTGPAGTATVNAVPNENAGLAGGLGFMVHLVVGAIGVAGATAIVNATSLNRLEQGLSDAGITMQPAEVALLNAAVPGGQKAQAAVAGLDAQSVEVVHSLLRSAFTAGMSHAFWLALGLAALGLVAVRLVNEARLHRALAKDPV